DVNGCQHSDRDCAECPVHGMRTEHCKTWRGCDMVAEIRSSCRSDGRFRHGRGSAGCPHGLSSLPAPEKVQGRGELTCGATDYRGSRVGCAKAALWRSPSSRVPALLRARLSS